MICPYCDSRLSVLPDNRVCPNCGAPLRELKALQFPTPPLGIYKQALGHMEIQEHGVHFYVKFWAYKVNRFVPYEAFTQVLYVPAGTELGFLSVREWKDRQLPMPKNSNEAAKDSTSIIFNRFSNEQYRQVYEFFRQCAQTANEAREA